MCLPRLSHWTNNILAEKKNIGKLVVRNPELINEIRDALVQQANGMLVCRTDFLIPVLTEVGFFGWLFKLKTYAAKFVTMIFAKQFKSSRGTYRRPITASCQGFLKQETRKKLAKKIFPWVAVAQRPMLLEELQEAIAIEPLQPYSDPERLANRIVCSLW